MRFRDAIRTELERRQAVNRRYSVRRFARALGIHHATLSRLLGGSRPVPARTINALAARLEMPAGAIAAFIAREQAAALAAAIRRPAFRPDSRWLATVTGVSVDNVNITLQALLARGHLRMPAQGEWVLDEGPQP